MNNIVIYVIFGKSGSNRGHSDGGLNQGVNVCVVKIVRSTSSYHAAQKQVIHMADLLITFVLHQCIVMHLYDYHILYEFLLDNHLYSFIFQPTYSISESWVARAYPGSAGHQAGTSPGQDAIPSQGTLTHTLRPRLLQQ